MKAKEDTRRYSLDELKVMRAGGDYAKTPSDAPTHEMDDAFWANARIVVPEAKKSIHLRVDADVLEWFRNQGSGYLTRMNAVLRGFMEANRRGK